MTKPRAATATNRRATRGRVSAWDYWTAMASLTTSARSWPVIVQV
jgi:hypothetical protein